MLRRSDALRAFVRTRPVLVVLGVALAIGIAVSLVRPFENKFPVYHHYAEALLHNGQHQPTRFWPTGYTTFVLAGLGLNGDDGVVLLQVLTYTALVLLAYAGLRLLRVGVVPAIVGGLAVGVHPQFLIAITRITDLNLTAPLLLALVTVALWANRYGLTAARAVLLGLAAGALFTVRPNLLAVLPVAIILVWRGLRLPQAALAVVSALVPVIATSTIMLGHPALISSNGPYNLAAGANGRTESTLLHEYNAENSLVAYLRHFKVTRLNELEAPSRQGTLNSFALDYIREHPANFVKLAGLKLFTAFRPDLRARQSGPRTAFDKAVDIASALPAVLWLAAVALARRRRLATPPLTTALVVLLLVLYVLPLALTNSDPRLRYGLDGVLLLHAASIVCRSFALGRPVQDRFAQTPLPAKM